VEPLLQRALKDVPDSYVRRSAANPWVKWSRTIPRWRSRHACGQSPGRRRNAGDPSSLRL